MNDFRLARGVRPSRYELRFELDLEAWRFTGSGRIALRLERAAPAITLHALEIEITRAGIDGGPDASDISYDVEAQTATLRFTEEVPAGEHVLALEWRGEIREALRGLYRSTRPGERYAATQFEAADARRAFPCFDEPEFKARFALELVHDPSLAAIANAPVAATEDLPDGRRRTRFAEMPPISTYLFAFTVGPYEETGEARTRTGVPVRVWLPRGMAERGVYARDAHVRSLEWLEEYTAIPYAYTKVDAIGIPDFEAGAMENPGAITYRTRLLDADRDTATTATLKAVFSVAAHELTHMWWGDLVTMAWWNDLWLNESFASFVGEKCTAALNPEWRYWRDFVAENARAFSLDALASTHPVSMEARNADEASERFDAVTYEKGSAVLRMIENFIGEERFRDGVRIYLGRFRERNATADDFWAALGEASGRDVTSLANAWIREPGHPLVSCAVRQVVGGLEVDVRQDRFYTDPDLAPGDQVWPVPIVLACGTPEGVQQIRYLLDSREGTVQLPGAAWYYPNGGGTGFYRTALDDRSVELLARGVRDLSAEERLALIDSQWALARARRASIGQFFELVAALRDEDDRAVLAAIADVLTWISVHALRDETAPAFRRFVEALYRPQLDRLGWQVRDGDGSDEREKRARALTILGRAAGAADVRREARERIEAHLDGRDPLDPDVASALASVAAAEGDAGLYERYLARMTETARTDAQEEARFRNALCDFEDPALAARTARAVFDGTIRAQERGLMLGRLLGSRHARAVAWPIAREAWDEHVATLAPALKQNCVGALAQLTPPELAREAAEFLGAKETADIKETVAQTLERLRLLSATARRMSDELGGALDRAAVTA